MSDKWHDKIPKSLLSEWDAKLKESGFYDIETGVGKDGHMLKGATPSFRLVTATGQAHRDFDDVADSEGERFNFHSGDKAEYYRIAERICVEKAHLLEPHVLYCWCLHSQGVGERISERLLDIPRNKIREHLKPLKDEIANLTAWEDVAIEEV